MPEHPNLNQKEQETKDKKMVDDLLAVVNPEAKPKKIYRLGNFNENGQGSRPLKLEFESHDVQSKVMKNAHKLKGASEELKTIGVSYDMSKDQRKEMYSLLDQAKELSKNSKDHIYKVRGLPGQMEIKKIQRQSQVVAN